MHPKISVGKSTKHIQKAVEIDPSWTHVKRKLAELIKK